MSDYDVVIIGGGAAGLSAALVLARAQRRILVIDSRSPRNARASHMHGYLSRDGMPPRDLLTIGRAEVMKYGGEIVDDLVKHASRRLSEEVEFQIELALGRTVTARRLLVATGLRDVLPKVGGLTDRWAQDVLHCPYCHGYEVRGQRLGVLGGSPESIAYAQTVRQWSEDVVYFTTGGALSQEDREQLTARSIEIVEFPVQRVVLQRGELYGVALDRHHVVRVEALFVPPHLVPNSEILAELGCELVGEGWPTTAACGQTTEPGIWVAGNVTDRRAQVITAAGEGSTAAIAINADLVSEDVHVAVRALRDAATTGASP